MSNGVQARVVGRAPVFGASVLAAMALAWPAATQAATERLGPEDLEAAGPDLKLESEHVYIPLSIQGARTWTSKDGRVTRWRVNGVGTFQLLVIRENPDKSFTVRARSARETAKSFAVFDTDLPIAKDEYVAIAAAPDGKLRALNGSTTVVLWKDAKYPVNVPAPGTGDIDPPATGEGVLAFNTDVEAPAPTPPPAPAPDPPSAEPLPPAPPVTPAPPAIPVPPQETGARVTAFRLLRSRFRVGPTATPVSTSRRRTRPAPRGSAFIFALSRPATVTITIERRARGIKVRRRGRLTCTRSTRAATRTARNQLLRTPAIRRLQGKTRQQALRRALRKRNCTVYVQRGTLRRNGTAATQRVPFSGRIGRRALPAGRYRARIGPATGASAANSRTANFQIVTAPRRRR